MSEGYYYRSDSSAWFVAIIVALAMLAIGYLVFKANPVEKVTADQARCMIANPGLECEEIQRWEPVKPEAVAPATPS